MAESSFLLRKKLFVGIERVAWVPLFSKLLCVCVPLLIVAGYASVCPRRALRQHRPWQLLGAGRQAGFEVGRKGRLCG